MPNDGYYQTYECANRDWDYRRNGHGHIDSAHPAAARRPCERTERRQDRYDKRNYDGEDGTNRCSEKSDD